MTDRAYFSEPQDERIRSRLSESLVFYAMLQITDAIAFFENVRLAKIDLSDALSHDGIRLDDHEAAREILAEIVPDYTKALEILAARLANA